MRVLVVLVAVGLLTACSTVKRGNGFTLTDQHVKTVQDGVRASMKDPDSAKFGPMAAVVDTDGAVTVCGFVNGRNSFGGYVGMQPFFGMMDAGALAFATIAIGSGETGRMTVEIQCRSRGLDLARI